MLNVARVLYAGNKNANLKSCFNSYTIAEIGLGKNTIIADIYCFLNHFKKNGLG